MWRDANTNHVRTVGCTWFIDSCNQIGAIMWTYIAAQTQKMKSKRKLAHTWQSGTEGRRRRCNGWRSQVDQEQVQHVKVIRIRERGGDRMQHADRLTRLFLGHRGVWGGGNLLIWTKISIKESGRDWMICALMQPTEYLQWCSARITYVRGLVKLHYCRFI